MIHLGLFVVVVVASLTSVDAKLKYDLVIKSPSKETTPTTNLDYLKNHHHLLRQKGEKSTSNILGTINFNEMKNKDEIKGDYYPKKRKKDEFKKRQKYYSEKRAKRSADNNIRVGHVNPNHHETELMNRLRKDKSYMFDRLRRRKVYDRNYVFYRLRKAYMFDRLRRGGGGESPFMFDRLRRGVENPFMFDRLRRMRNDNNIIVPLTLETTGKSAMDHTYLFDPLRRSPNEDVETEEPLEFHVRNRKDDHPGYLFDRL